MEITRQGKIVVNTVVDQPALNALVLRVDLDSKYAKLGSLGITAEGVPAVYLRKDKYTLYAQDDASGETEIAFPEYAGYTIMCAEVARYTLTVCLCKL
jgi:hypothetical protein